MSSTEQQAPGIKRTDLQQHDLSIPGREVVHNRVDISPQAPAIKHKHPGEEIIYVLEGSLDYQVEGEPPTTLEAGDVLLVPAETIHAVRNVGTANGAELATYFRAPSSATSIRPACRTHSRALSRRSRSLPAETGRSKHAHVPGRIHRRRAKRNT